MPMKAFHIDRHLVTNAQYKAFVDATGYAPQDAPAKIAQDIEAALASA